ncbi:hypothetical protein SteCoe_8794 [Stentor coeruleus]|uniref:Uncharacterized protein n=1 Tax=Stentor coeruleus TaxID=5963 RepID=A0A1R2CJE5_9CILI|nr:hypothetical protein SteCoe_8794 [Stentor coeruleus]
MINNQEYCLSNSPKTKYMIKITEDTIENSVTDSDEEICQGINLLQKVKKSKFDRKTQTTKLKIQALESILRLQKSLKDINSVPMQSSDADKCKEFCEISERIIGKIQRLENIKNKTDEDRSCFIF